MFDYTNYVPILRWKRGEQIALRKLFYADKAKMTPLIELIPKDFSPKKPEDIVDVNQVLHEKAKEISENWGPAPLFVDLWHLDTILQSSHGLHPLDIPGPTSTTCPLTSPPARPPSAR